MDQNKPSQNSVWERLAALAASAPQGAPSQYGASQPGAINPIPIDPVTGLPVQPQAAQPQAPTNMQRGMKSIRGAFGN